MAGHGGKREGAGRKPKAEELSVIEAMDKCDPTGEIWQRLWKLVKADDTAAIKLWLAYRYGAPQQTITQSSVVKIVNESTDNTFAPPAPGTEEDSSGA